MAVFPAEERNALKSLRNGELIPRELLEKLVRRKLALAHPMELTEAGRIACELLLEIDLLCRDSDAGTRGAF